MKYRQAFGLSWEQVLKIPPQVFFTDLEMMTIESDVEEGFQQKARQDLEKAKTKT
jgi:hypothetical protein